MYIKKKLVKLLSEYFNIGDSYAYNLTRVKSAFTCGTIRFDDFEEFDEETVEDIAAHLIANGVTLQDGKDTNVLTKWISVKERLPDKDGCYIVTACDEGCSCGDGIWYDTVVIEAEHYKGEWSWNENGTEYDITDFVTHWQPMPTPPKGE